MKCRRRDVMILRSCRVECLREAMSRNVELSLILRSANLNELSDFKCWNFSNFSRKWLTRKWQCKSLLYVKVARQKRQKWKEQKRFDEKMKCKCFEEKIFEIDDIEIRKVELSLILKSSFLNELNFVEIFELIDFWLIWMCHDEFEIRDNAHLLRKRSRYTLLYDIHAFFEIFFIEHDIKIIDSEIWLARRLRDMIDLLHVMFLIQ